MMEAGKRVQKMDGAGNGELGKATELRKKLFHKTIAREAPVPIETKVIGTIPSWLKGNLLRNGPGKFEVGDERVDHLFDGLAFLHRFIIEEGGKVKYQGRFLKSDIYQKAEKHQRLVFSGFGTPARHPDPCKTLFQRVFSFFQIEFPDNCNVNWMKVGDEFYALTETPKLKKIKVDSLDVLDTVDIEKLVGVHTATAHPHTARDGTSYNLGENATSGASIFASIQASTYSPAYYHSFGFTENYIIFVEQPLHINLLKGRLWNQAPMTDSMDFYPDSKVRFHLIRREDGAVVPTTFTADAFFTFHHVNAYETDDGKHVVVDMCCYEDAQVLKRANMESILSGNLTVEDCRVRRYILPISADNTKEGGGKLVTMVGSKATATLTADGAIHCDPEELCDVSLETPQINYAEFNGRDYRYLYGVGGNMQQLHKIDVKTHRVVTWFSPGCFPSEPIFIPAPTKNAEDDGVILSCVSDVGDDERRPFLLVLDAHSFTEIARAVIPLPISMYSLHGIFVDVLS